MSSLFASNWPVVHIARRYDGGVDPDTGNPTLHKQLPPVVRWVQEIVQKSSSDELDGDGEFVDRVASTLQMAVDDCTVYNTDDQVIVFPPGTTTVAINPDGTYTPEGEAYWVDGLPDDQRGGPFTKITDFSVFGGIVMLKRVT